jgi:hypothetical protein
MPYTKSAVLALDTVMHEPFVQSLAQTPASRTKNIRCIDTPRR